MPKILLSILIISIFPFISFAQEDTLIEEVKASEIEELNQKEEERTEQIANLLGFVLPQYTDNPSYVITFKDPSPDAKGVEISLDGKDYALITSPYTFPALSIGDHLVKFRFNDQTGTVKILEYQLIVIPRVPIPNTPEIGEKSIKISGTALANSDIIYTLSANTFHNQGTAKTDGDGDWIVEVTPQEGLSSGIYSFTAYSRKYGYASELSETISFSIGETTNNLESTSNSINFSFKDLTKENIINAFKTNTDLLILIAGGFFLGVLLTNIFRNLVDGDKTDRKIKEVEKLITKKGKESEKDMRTLRELFGEKNNDTNEKKESKKEEETPKEEPESTQPAKEESIINKDMFLRKYKNLDPDNEDGKEVKKKVKISLTSKEE